MQLAALGCLLVMAAGVHANESCEDMKYEMSRVLQIDTTATWRNLMTLSSSARKCDGDGSGALDAAEFSGCLHQLLDVERKLNEDANNERSACLEKFRKEADEDENDTVDFAEYYRWSSEWAPRCGRCSYLRELGDDADESPVEADRSAVESVDVLQPSCRGCCCCCRCCKG